ncbi:MAG TPA: monovalent cation/H+ antiporter subunit A [Burkholderiales bacterium]|nr:monovalent cation/H+ antiporter subunit A [Burkholderiales bacterium]
MTAHTFIFVLLALPFVGSAAAILLPQTASKLESTLAAGIACAALIVTAALFPEIAAGRAVHAAIRWLPAYGVDFSLRMDGYAWMFAMLVTGIGLLVVVYARYYMSPRDPIPRFYCFLLAFMGSMLGVVLSGNLLQLVFFWELTSLFSFLLIGYWHRNAAARDGARMAFITTSAGGLCLLAAVLLVGHVVGSYDLDVVLASGDEVRSHALYAPTLVLILIAALTKSAQFPFHFWLPNAMVAPTPVSAYLHSAAMVKLGVFLLARIWPVFGGTDLWMWTVGLAGMVTFVLGAYIAIFQNDLKGLLAYSTISHLGLITALLGMNSPLATVAAIFHMMNHATFKASLFMATGIIDHETGTRDIRRLSGLRRAMPITATLAIVAAAAMAGVPLLNGFLSKEMFFAQSLHVEGPVPWLDRTLPYVATTAGMFSVAYSVRFIHGAFFGPDATDLPRKPQEPPRWMRAPIDVLVLACVVVGVVPALTIGPFLDVAVRAVLGAETPTYSLAVWHGLNAPLVMSVLALAGGGGLYLSLRGRLAAGSGRMPLLLKLDARRIFDAVMMAVSVRWAAWLERAVGTERLQAQLRSILLVALAFAFAAIAAAGAPSIGFAVARPDIAFTLLWAVGGACALAAAVLAKFHRLAALILAGGAGLATCLTFMWLSAPDLALTQLVVEIVTTVLLLLGLRWLPKRIPFEHTRAGALAALPRRARDLAIAVLAGLGLSALAYAVMIRPLPQSISEFFVKHAVPDGGGTNVVNVILVDFRGFDTFGEITVLAAVGIAVYSLLRRFRPAVESMRPPPQQRTHGARALADDMLVPAVLMRLMLAGSIVLGAYLLLRGHNLPGGGFVAGLTVAVGLIVQYMAGGTRWIESRLVLKPVALVGAGLLIAGTTGAGAWFFAHPFLTSHVLHARLPVLGDVHLPSAFFFDIGVFMVVLGSTVLMLIALAHQSLRAHRAEEET